MTPRAENALGLSAGPDRRFGYALRGERNRGRNAEIDTVANPVLSGDHLSPDEPLSPELVLVLPPELRAEALARLGEPNWPKPKPRPRLRQAAPVPPPAVRKSFARSLGEVVGARVLQLSLIFVAVTILTLALSAVANAIR